MINCGFDHLLSRDYNNRIDHVHWARVLDQGDLMTCSAVALKSEMSAFYGGSMQRYRHDCNRRFLYSEGVKTVATLAGAYWLVDLIALEMAPRYDRAFDSGQAGTGVVRLTVPSRFDLSAHTVVSLCLDEDAPDIYARELDRLDYPEGTWLFYLGRDELVDGNRVTSMIIPEEYRT